MSHPNSLKSYHELDKQTRQNVILNVYIDSAGALTDREVADILGFADLNMVRPRITGLVACGKLIETGNTKDPITNRRVRLCKAFVAQVQKEFAL